MSGRVHLGMRERPAESVRRPRSTAIPGGLSQAAEPRREIGAGAPVPRPPRAPASRTRSSPAERLEAQPGDVSLRPRRERTIARVDDPPGLASVT